MNSFDSEYRSWCRVCSTESNTMIDIFAQSNGVVLLADMIFGCTQLIVQPHDKKPSKICCKCNENLQSSHELCSLAKESDLKFGQLVSLRQAVQTPQNDEINDSTFSEVELGETKIKEEPDTDCIEVDNFLSSENAQPVKREVVNWGECKLSNEVNAFDSEYLRWCRICAKKTYRWMADIFDTQKRGMSIAEMIFYCTQLEVDPNDKRPSKICWDCCGNLSVSYDFRHMALDSEEKFQKLVAKQEMPLKTEAESEASEVYSNDDLETEWHNDNSDIEIDAGNAFKEEQSNEETEGTSGSIVSNPETKNQQAKPLPLKTKIEEPFIESVFLDTADAQVEWSPEISTENQSQEIIRIEYSKQTSKTQIKRCECYKCKLRLTNLNGLREHMKMHIDATPNKCKVCQMYYSTKRFDRHLCKGKNIQCEYCTKVFNSTIKLLKHLESHKDQLLMNHCPKTHCASKQFPMKSLFEWHLEMHSRMLPHFQCTMCDNRFTSRSCLLKHFRKHENGECKFLKKNLLFASF